jgi:hypothetical protein
LNDASGSYHESIKANHASRTGSEKSTVTVLPLVNSNDSLRTITTPVVLSNGLSFTEIITDTLKANSVEPSVPARVVKNVHLPQPIYWKFVGLVFILILFVTMVYGPIAAFLVELFPTKIRYTSMSLPYHIGNGVFGGLVPFIGLLLTTTYPTDKLVGLWYSIGVTALCLIIGVLYLRNKIDNNIND